MTEILYTLLIGPLETLFGMIYYLAIKVVRDPGFCILVLSMVMNLLLLPLYRRTDAIQAEAIETEKQMKPYVDLIKKTFRGDERFMLLQTCYRQHDYKPTDALKGLTPLVLEIPFFMAAYNFLSGLQLLHGASFGPIRDLSAPDGLLVLGGVTLNLLPILMTVINLISSAIYTRSAPAKTKVQLYGMAALFLVLLYQCPSGLVLYWTLNNLFSLVKNLLMQLKKPLPVLACLCTPVSLGAAVWIWLRFQSPVLKLAGALAVLAAGNAPLGLLLLKKYRKTEKRPEAVLKRGDHLSYFCAAGILTVVLGVLIPSALISASPEEFIIRGLSMDPNRIYLLYTGALAAGTFLVWMGLLYLLASPGWKRILTGTMWVLCGMAVVDQMFFGRNYGTISKALIFDLPMQTTGREILMNLLVLAAVSAGILALYRKKRQLLQGIGIAVLLAAAGLSAVNILGSQGKTGEKLEQLNAAASQDSVFTLSRTGKNVVVIMSDRAVGALVPYIFTEKPELQQQFAGFTYYPNTLSFGAYTNMGLPSVFGGYEYIPEVMNRRDDLPLAEKHGEALKLMPVLFSQAGYQVTVADPTYAGYGEIPDLSIYAPYPEIRSCITMGKYNRPDPGFVEEMRKRMFCYSVLRASPVCLHTILYGNGNYMQADAEYNGSYSAQTADSSLTAEGRDLVFESSYSVLDGLSQLTEVTDRPENTFQMMCNETAHSPVMLQLPDYSFQDHVDNTPYDSPLPVRTDWNGNTIVLENNNQITHYHCNMASYLAIGRWLDYLREQGVYDNTRIIIVGDHGRGLDLWEDLHFDMQGQPVEKNHNDILYYNPALLVKDFGSGDFRVEETFMTNADTPAIAMAGLIEDPVNPFTGNPVNAEHKKCQPLQVSLTARFDIGVNCGNTYHPDPWALVTGDMFDPASWQVVPPDAVN